MRTPYPFAMVLLSLVDDPETGRAVWVVEFDGVLAGRFENKESVADYLRTKGYKLSSADEWPRARLL